MAASNTGSKSLQLVYSKRYRNINEEKNTTKKKMKNVKQEALDLFVGEEAPVWLTPVKLEEGQQENDSTKESGFMVDTAYNHSQAAELAIVPSQVPVISMRDRASSSLWRSRSEMVDFRGFQVLDRHASYLTPVYELDRDFWSGASVKTKLSVACFLSALGEALCIADIKPRRLLTRVQLLEVAGIIENIFASGFRVESLWPVLKRTKKLLGFHDSFKRLDELKDELAGLDDLKREMLALMHSLEDGARVRDADCSLLKPPSGADEDN